MAIVNIATGGTANYLPYNATYDKPDGGVIKGGGNIGNTGIWEAAALGLRVATAQIGTYPESGVGGVSGLLSTAAFGINLAEGMIQRVTTSITDTTNYVLRSASRDRPYESGIVPVEGRTTFLYASGIRNGTWCAYSGVFVARVSGKADKPTSTDAFGADWAARSTRAYQGAYRFLHGSVTPSGGTYDPKTG